MISQLIDRAKRPGHRTLKIVLGILYDFIAGIVAAGIASVLSEEANLSGIQDIVPFFLIGNLMIIAALSAFHCYSVSYSHVGIYEISRVVFAFFLCGVAETLLYIPYFGPLHGFCINFLHLYLYMTVHCVFVLCLRLSLRIYGFLKSNSRLFGKNIEPVMVIGGGDAGTALIREMRSSRYLSYRPVCVLDDNPALHGSRIMGVPVVGSIADCKRFAEEYKIGEIFVAVPSASAKAKAKILRECQKTEKNVKILPGLYQLVNGDVSVSRLRSVNITDLLGRDEVHVNLDEIMGYIENRTVLVTGGGGSIGSELCRQIATHRPKKLIILDIYENNAYDIEQELRRKMPNLPLVTLIASVRDRGKIEDVFRTYSPEIVFNAAAHKHVPLMETSPNEAVKNNVFGTLNVAEMADKYHVLRFVQISTDKAVNPTNIMGATKRICEMIIQTLGRHSETEFVAVRFGNVLGSNGSVIPLFQKQIAEGGPVTVTHKDIVRYFMTIPEAVSLVLQAGAYAEGGQIFVLDMGEQVRIYDLAVNLIRLSGYKPEEDIEIRITGLRPGEKLYEERLMDEEGLRKTPNASISIGKPLDIDEKFLRKKLSELYDAAYHETDRMKRLVSELVTTYTPDEK